MKRKGFTLIELLAVIVVLAIIALIATPIVMNTIKKSKKGAAERSADSFVKQVETAVTTERLNGNIIEDGEYEITSDGNLCKDKSASCSDDQKIKIEMSGTKPKSGKVKITNGVAQISTKLTVGDYDVKYNTESKKYEATEKSSTSSEDDTPTVVYRWSTDKINIGDTIDPSDTTKFASSPATLKIEPDGVLAIPSDWGGPNNLTWGLYYCLKHVLDKDNKVVESYACALTDENEEYCIKGGDPSYYGWAENEADYTGNMLILNNAIKKGVAIGGAIDSDEFAISIPVNENYCLTMIRDDDDSNDTCEWQNFSGSSPTLTTRRPGDVVVTGGVNYFRTWGSCYINTAGSSSCTIY